MLWLRFYYSERSSKKIIEDLDATFRCMWNTYPESAIFFGFKVTISGAVNHSSHGGGETRTMAWTIK
jgi:hypothetical protein